MNSPNPPAPQTSNEPDGFEGVTLDDWERDAVGRFLRARNRAVDGILTMGQILCDVKNRIEHGRWRSWLSAAGINVRTAQILMRISKDQNILRHHRDHIKSESCDSHLPADRAVLAELCGMEEEQFDDLVEAEVIHPEMKRGDVRKALVRRDHLPPPSLEKPWENGHYRSILADPPWRFNTYASGGGNRSAENHYPTMSVDEIAALPVRELAAKDAVLFLWTTSEMLTHALHVMAAWGFSYKTIAFTWVKEGPIGLGYWTRKRSEICLLGTVGNPKRRSASVPDVIQTPRQQHSAKPEESYLRIEELVGGPCIELFSRKPFPGWAGWGNDRALKSFVAITTPCGEEFSAEEVTAIVLRCVNLEDDELRGLVRTGSASAIGKVVRMQWQINRWLELPKLGDILLRVHADSFSIMASRETKRIGNRRDHALEQCTLCSGKAAETLLRDILRGGPKVEKS